MENSERLDISDIENLLTDMLNIVKSNKEGVRRDMIEYLFKLYSDDVKMVKSELDRIVEYH